MKIRKYGYIAIVLFCGAIVTACSDSDKEYEESLSDPDMTYEKSINVETITWEQLDPGVRKFIIKFVAYGMEKTHELMDDSDDAMAQIIKALELNTQADTSDLTGEYKAYHKALLPINKFMIEDLKKEEPVPLPTSMSEMGEYQQKLMDKTLKVRAKYQTQMDEINRKYPNAAALFDSHQSGANQPKIMELFSAKYNIVKMTMQSFESSSSPQEASRKTAQKLYALAEEQE